MNEDRDGPRPDEDAAGANDKLDWNLAALFEFPPLYIIVGSLLAFAVEAVRTNLLVGLAVLGGLICLYAYASKDSDAGRDVVGDNCYFIGFVFTLVVISASIYFARGTEIGDLDDLLDSVAIALATSVVGMLLRFVMNHGAKEPGVELEEKIRKISLEAARLSVALDDVVKATDEYNLKLREETETLGKQLNDILARLMGDLANKAYEALSSVGIETVHGELRRAVDAHVGAVSLAGSSIERTAKSVDLIAERIGETASTLSGSAEALKNSIDKVDWDQAGETFGAFSEKISVVGEALGQLLDYHNKIAQASAADVQKMEEARKNFAAAMEEMRKDIDQVAEIKRKYRERFDEAANLALDETHRLYARLIAGASIAIDNIGQLGEMAENVKILADKAKKDGESGAA